ncbi:MAG: DASS family Na+:divalent anion symporter [Algoriphagus marincola HL-49]|uniref:DASS family Na+:divalent anion symporter n=1 Tax=Algoriphagus marincola HL-49 TaxID=1305737 RepID=A0A0P7Y3I3_9BACT|nr:MAG: DASS family Na+:divalent anion symporter [Algoriphagus marincola HL-49]
MTLSILSTLIIVIGLVLSLYRGWVRPSLAFLGVAFLFILLQIIQIEDLLLGLANKQIILIFLLIILTSGIQQNLGKGFFFSVFQKNLSAFQFRLRMMLTVSSLSSVLNNTPVVAFMIPFVKNWAESNNYSASKFLIPLSFATILGGMITLIGTSTNLVLNGLIIQSGLPSLLFSDFLYLGLIVAFFGIIYLTIFSEALLPNHTASKAKVLKDLHEYLVETRIRPDSPLIGKTIEEAGLRHLKELFLVELKRGDRVIPAVSSERLLQANDYLFFAGNTNAILNLINQKYGLELPEESHIQSNGFSSMTEAVIPSGSVLAGSTLKQLNFRDRFKASVISVYRKGEKVKENLGETQLKEGDLLLLLCAEDFEKLVSSKDLISLTKSGEIEGAFSFKKNLPSILGISVLLLGIFGAMDLFIAALIGIVFMLLFRVINLNQVREAIDLDLLTILVSALAIGVAIQKSGTSGFLVENLSLLLEGKSPLLGISILFIVTLGLTSLITNAAAVSIMFPIAYELGMQSGLPLTPFFVTIAFAASADFMTPIGYQTNLMVFGPGNYRFADYTKIGLPLTLIYGILVISFIHFYYF